MRAIHVDGESLIWAEVEAPRLGPGEVRVAVACAGVNRADLAQRAGRYPPPPGASPILGLEVSGTIMEVADGVTAWAVGDRVMALLTGGGYAEEVVVPAGCVLALPAGWTFEEGAATVEVFATAWLNLLHEGGLARREPGATVLLHAGGSGVGTAAIQILRQRGHRCFVTAGSGSKIDRCIALGAEAGHDRHTGPWREAVAAWAPGGVDMILDPVGGSYLEDNVASLALEGTLVLIGLLDGRHARLDLGRLLVKRLRLVGSTLRSRSDTFKANLLAEMQGELGTAWAARQVMPAVDRAFPVTEAAAAHAHVASNLTFGACVLTVGR